MDSSLSVNEYFEVSKSWISNLLQDTSDLFEHENDKLFADNNGKQSVCLRTALIMFDHDAQMVWNLDYFDGPYNHDKARSMMTEAVKENEMQRLSGTHIKDVLEYTINNVFPKMHPLDSNVVLMLSDGRPSSCYSDVDQNPCQISPNVISKAFKDSNVKFLIVAVGDDEEKQEAVTRIESTFECLFDDVDRMEKSIIVSPTYFDLDAITRSIEDAVQSHTCGLANYECDVAMYPPSYGITLKQDWNYASYRFKIGSNADDIWPYVWSIKVQTDCKYDTKFSAKLMHYDAGSKTSTLLQESDQTITC